ncbi:hypothetical protein CDQ84_02150 [Clostridium thermosuccinogenes]|jgi:hypothetical protein|uniref:Aspartyl-phosphate phosphatase Spo0E family protein n=1 Tax=Clostridium thermosuccinogenes TaxID=84032 RepID=A0A2K2F0V1_9CLOT|nr:aspartyl-phosphate phosphatase Spo0E family protein [Pseudoclostridium thermosuccinogenes]AUS96925.1 hypothetical protein CDO33_11070 [Pseudoclostridium thermosuccinogenes]PNT92406.1 hypothetical protein CDQ83_02170 [Pseudoclostridium thermosuccinogenes]PNT99658.1 hypothetical protein CDQ85_02185 [Pseudoclostridium thermosuccinogenes]PNU01208.1 hypothetical protein CDQ84_02150 [Pseudoclostridium thermosuccinogenes]
MQSGTKDDIMVIKCETDNEIQKLRGELEDLILVKENNCDSEVLEASRKLDEIINRYYLCK